MLVLSRKLREQITIPGLDITVTVLSVGGNRVQLGIEAPAHIDISRPDTVYRGDTGVNSQRAEPLLV